MIFHTKKLNSIIIPFITVSMAFIMNFISSFMVVKKNTEYEKDENDVEVRPVEISDELINVEIILQHKRGVNIFMNYLFKELSDICDMIISFTAVQ